MKLTLADNEFKFAWPEKLVLAVLPCVACLASLMLSNTPPRYYVETKVIAEHATLPNWDRRAMRKMDRSLRRLIIRQQRIQAADVHMSVETKLAILRSRQFLHEFIVEHELAPKLLYKLWDEKTQTWKQARGGIIKTIVSSLRGNRSPRNNLGAKKQQELLHYLALLQVNAGLRVKRDKTSAVISIAFKWHDAEFAARLLNTLVASVNQSIGERKQQRVLSAITNFQELRAQQILPRMKRVLSHEIATLKLELVTDNPEKNPAFRVLDPAWPTKDLALRVPKIKLLLIFLTSSSIIFLCVLARKLRTAAKRSNSTQDHTTISRTAYRSTP